MTIYDGDKYWVFHSDDFVQAKDKKTKTSVLYIPSGSGYDHPAASDDYVDFNKRLDRTSVDAAVDGFLQDINEGSVLVIK